MIVSSPIIFHIGGSTKKKIGKIKFRKYIKYIFRVFAQLAGFV